MSAFAPESYKFNKASEPDNFHSTFCYDLRNTIPARKPGVIHRHAVTITIKTYFVLNSHFYYRPVNQASAQRLLIAHF